MHDSSVFDASDGITLTEFIGLMYADGNESDFTSQDIQKANEAHHQQATAYKEVFDESLELSPDDSWVFTIEE